MTQTVEISHCLRKGNRDHKVILSPCDLSQTEKTGTISTSLSLSQYLPKVTSNHNLVSEKVHRLGATLQQDFLEKKCERCFQIYFLTF